MANRKDGFLAAQFRYLFRTYAERKSWRHKAFILVEAGRLPLRYSRLRSALNQPPPPSTMPGKTCTVILLSHNRPQNMPVLIQGALQNDFVRKVVVSNSNRAIRITEWITIRDKRLTVIDEEQITRPGHRFVLAERESGEYFLSVDDDIFFTPRQWAVLFEHLLNNDAAPHGVTGENYRPGVPSSNGSPFHHVSAVEGDVDVLIGVYAFTRQQLGRLFTLAEKLQLGPLTNIANGEDILLSFSGTLAARIHDVGRLFCCASESLPGVALWKTLDGFWDERVRLFQRTLEMRMTMSSPFITRDVRMTQTAKVAS